MANAPDSKMNPVQAPALVFVNLSNPAAGESEDVRRLVRSSATRHSHRDPQRKPKARKSQRRKAAAPPVSPSRSSASSRGESPSEDDRSPVSITGALFSAEDRAEIITQLDKPPLQIEVESHLKLVNQALQEPNNAYPVEPEEWFPWVLSYYRTVYLPAGLQLMAVSGIESTDFIDWFMREALSEPALFYAQLLCACTPLVIEKRLAGEHVDWLRAMVVQSINNAVSDATRVSSSATLLAIALTALHEFVYGEQQVAIEFHGRAFARLLQMRGGWRALNLSRLAWKMLLWIDGVLGSGSAVDGVSLQLMKRWVPEYAPEQ